MTRRDVSQFGAFEHITDPNERETLAKYMRKKYEAGATIRQLVEESNRSYGFVHRLLHEAGTVLRKRGGKTTKKGKK